MDAGTKRGLLIALIIAAVGLAACVVRTHPVHRGQYVQAQKHQPEKRDHD